MEEELYIPSLVPIEHELFTASRREIFGCVLEYHDAVLKVPIGPIRAGVTAEKIIVNVDRGTINVVTRFVSFHGYVRLSVIGDR